MSYLTIKALHLIFVICWFAGLFYVGRIFIYFKEAEKKPQKEKLILQSQFLVMGKRLMYIILWPSVLLTSVFGWAMIIKNPTLLELDWMKVKLVLVTLLLFYVVICQFFLNQMHNGIIKTSEFKLRLFSEAATLFLISLVFIATLKNNISWIYATLYFFIISVVLMLLVRMYKKYILKK